MTQTQAKGQRQRWVGLKDRVEADGWTDRQTKSIALLPVLARSVKTHTRQT